jgi:hypothetical protein
MKQSEVEKGEVKCSKGKRGKTVYMEKYIGVVSDEK